jgi:DNA mismatch repair ATPase MutS
LNAVLAFAGAPVRAASLRLSPLQLGSVIRVSDSLQSGKSLFFAAIERLKRVASFAGQQPPLLFLLDELLAGTNSHDRLIGAEAILRRLVDEGAIGIVTTHDLALTEIAASLAPAADNAHFRDVLVGDRMQFDYTLRPGVVDRGNALALMRLVGLMPAEEKAEDRE